LANHGCFSRKRYYEQDIGFIILNTYALVFTQNKNEKIIYEIFFLCCLAMTNSKFPAYERVVLKAGKFDIVIETYFHCFYASTYYSSCGSFWSFG